jgi:CRP-like cAMP-binding protein
MGVGKAPEPTAGEEPRVMTKATKLLTVLPPPQRERLMTLAREVSFPEDARIFEAGGTADRFWVIRSGAVSLDQRVTSVQRVTVASLGAGDLLGWSWLFPPYQWDFGAEAFSPVRAYEFDAASVLRLCEEDPDLGLILVRSVAEILAHRLEMTRGKLMEQYSLRRTR